MKIKMVRVLACFLAVILLQGCVPQEISRYRYSFMGTFDTMVENIGYVQREADFDKYAEFMYGRFVHYDKLFDKYNSYNDVNNIKTINENAGIAPVKVEKPILDLIILSKEWAKKTDGAVNIAMGPVLEVWHNYRERYPMGSEGELPEMSELEAKRHLTDINKVLVDEVAGTVYLSEKGMSLDVGSVAKGYATELICSEMYEQGYHSFIVSSGGNVRIMDKPMDDKLTAWVVGLQNPHGEGYVDSVVANNIAIVTSGDYQRYYMHEGKRIHHIIDPKTLMPADGYSSISIVTGSSTEADILSTALYILPKEQGEKLLAESGANAIWVDVAGNVSFTDGLKPMLKQAGGATSVPKE